MWGLFAALPTSREKKQFDATWTINYMFYTAVRYLCILV